MAQQHPSIDFNDEPPQKITESSHPEDENDLVFKQLSFSLTKSSDTKKQGALSKSEDELKKTPVVVLLSFPLSLPLLNLLRDPAVNNHKFEKEFLERLGQAILALQCQD